MDTPGSVLFVAAEPREFSGVLRFCTAVGKVPMELDWVRAGELGGRRVILAANGAGWVRAGRAVEVARAKERVNAVVSTGFCGALDPALEIGRVFVASMVTSEDGRFPALVPVVPPGYASGVVASIDHIAQTAGEKRQLHSAGAAAVEMEAAGVARAAAEAGLSFYCVRSVTDLAGESFANDFNRVLRSDGHFDTIDLLASVTRKPMTLLPELLRLRRRCRIAAHTLGEFLAHCRF